MNQPFARAEDGSVFISDAVLKSQAIFSATGVSLPAACGEKIEEKADLLERRLSRLEQALGLEPICVR